MQTVPMHVPLLGQQRQAPQQPTADQVARAHIQQAMNQVALGMFTKLAADHVADREAYQDIDVEKLRMVAKNCSLAARAYFEGLGIIQPEG